MTFAGLLKKYTGILHKHMEKRRSLTIVLASASSLILLCLCLLLFFPFIRGTEKTDKSGIPSERPSSVHIDELVLPPEPGISFDAQLSRTRVLKWDGSDKQRWFTDVSDSMLMELKKVNSRMITGILESVP